jgi:hypothetical protein
MNRDFVGSITYPTDEKSTPSLRGYDDRRYQRLETSHAVALGILECRCLTRDCPGERLHLQSRYQWLTVVSNAFPRSRSDELKLTVIQRDRVEALQINYQTLVLSPSEKLPYEWPPDLACTFTPTAAAHATDSDTC